MASGSEKKGIKILGGRLIIDENTAAAVASIMAGSATAGSATASASSSASQTNFEKH